MTMIMLEGTPMSIQKAISTFSKFHDIKET